MITDYYRQPVCSRTTQPAQQYALCSQTPQPACQPASQPATPPACQHTVLHTDSQFLVTGADILNGETTPHPDPDVCMHVITRQYVPPLCIT